MTDETAPQSTEQPVEKTPEEIAAEAATAERASQDAPSEAQIAPGENLTPPPGDVIVPATEDPAEVEAGEDTVAAPEIETAPEYVHYAKRGIHSGPKHTQHSQHSAHHKGIV